jgi:hypothetical protein
MVKKVRFLFIGIFFFLGGSLSFAQSTTTYPGGAVNWTALPWTGGTAPTTNGGTYTENLIVGSPSQLGNGDNLTVNISFTLNGNLTLDANGSTPTFTIPAGVTVTINGNFTDANNNVTFVVNGTLVVTGTLKANNGTAFSGTGSVSGGTLDLGSGTTCPGGCPNLTFNNCIGNTAFCSAHVLPVTLLFFTLMEKESSINLNWATASEINFDYFDLQKSSDGLNFNFLGQINGNGTTNERHDYSFEDSFPFIGKNYYRLTSVDFDNYRETFNVIVKEYSGEKDFKLSPNPSDGQTITLNFNFDSMGGQVVIYDNMGSIVDSFQANEGGRISFTNTLKDGIYFAKYSAPSFTKATRFLVKR